MTLLEPKNFFFELPLYTPITIDSTNEEEFENLLDGNYKIDAYNPFLKEETTYYILPRPYFKIDTFSSTEFRTIVFAVNCLRTNFITRTIVQVRTNNVGDDEHNIIYKIGQYPSIADLHISQVKKYDKVLSKEKLKEFTRAIGLAANGVGIGSFVYLRRIFEYLIEEAHAEAKEEEGDWDEDQFKINRMSEKISQLHHHLPEFLVENKDLYGILSKGVHSLDETECLQYFDTVKLGIELILDGKVEKWEKEKKILEAKREISRLTETLKRK